MSSVATTKTLSPPQVAERYGVKPEKVIRWIRSGQLRAVNVSDGMRPRYRIPADALIEFEQRRAATGRLKLVAVRTWKPSQGQSIDLEQVESEILMLRDRYKLATVAFDPWQAEYLGQRLRTKGVSVEAVQFTPSNLQSMASATLDAFRERLIDLYEHDDLLADL